MVVKFCRVLADSSKPYPFTCKITDTRPPLRRKPLIIQRFIALASVAPRRGEHWRPHHGLKPMATIMRSLRDLDSGVAPRRKRVSDLSFRGLKPHGYHHEVAPRPKRRRVLIARDWLHSKRWKTRRLVNPRFTPRAGGRFGRAADRRPRRSRKRITTAAGSSGRCVCARRTVFSAPGSGSPGSAVQSPPPARCA